MSNNKFPKLSLIIPCFNEADNIEATLESIDSYLSTNFVTLSYEILPINDGSTDGTANVITRFAASHSQVVAGHGFVKNCGRGAAIKYGISISSGEYVICLDADLSYDVDHIGEILQAFKQYPEPDLVVVSAYMPGGSVMGVPKVRLLLSRCANWILSGSFSGRLHTVTCVVRGYKGELLRKTPFFEDGKELHLEMLGKLIVQGARVVEIPGRLHWKNTKQNPRRKTSLKFFFSAKQHLLYGLLLRPTRFFHLLTWLTLIVGIYESIIIALAVQQHFFWSGGFKHSLWLALYTSFVESPHTFVIAGVAYILGLQMLFALIFLKLLMMQHNEMMRLQLYFGTRSTPHNSKIS
jgi:dolichol-phosphate mannosyltransferase